MIKTNAFKLLKENKVNITAQNTVRMIFDVNSEIVIIQKKAGRTAISCSCQNHSRFVNENPLCKHKLAAITYWMIKDPRMNAVWGNGSPGAS